MKPKLKQNIFYQNLYRWLLYPLLIFGFRCLALFHPKIKKALIMRAKQKDQWPWLLSEEKLRPIWFHCASGEFEYAKPLIRELKKRHPHLKIMVTYFSPSAIEMVQNDKFIDFSTPLPWDRPKIIDSFLKFHKPRALLIARTDAWPEMLMQAEMANIPAMMFAATLADKSSRMGFLSRHFSAWVLGMLNEIQCVSPADLNNFKTLGLGIITQVAGDTRYDQVIERLNHPKPIKTQLFENTENILVAGSTWPEDEAVLLQMYLKNPNIKLCIVPHEPTSSHLENIRSQAEALGLQIQLYTKSEKWRVGEILVVDQVGILAELYSHAQFAFVGGSFKKNVHSVMEPLAAGCVTFIGPKHQNNREALDIKKEKMTSLGGESAVIEVTGAEQWSQKFTSLTPYDFKRVKVEIKNLISQRSGLALKKALKWIEEKAL